MGRFIKTFFLFAGFLTISSCDTKKRTSVYTENYLGSLVMSKSCSGQGGSGGHISIYQKTGYSSSGSSSHKGPVTLQGTGFKSPITGCPSPISFKCEAVAVTASAFGQNLTGNERYVCNGGVANFSYNARTAGHSFSGPYNYGQNQNPYTSPSSAYQSSADILRGEVWLLADGPLKARATGNLQFHITAGRQIPLPCRVQFDCR